MNGTIHPKSEIGQAITALESTTCEHCQGKKKSGQIFCRTCYFALPPRLRQALYSSAGYAKAYEEAKDWLRNK
jgi:hypothetical protein